MRMKRERKQDIVKKNQKEEECSLGLTDMWKRISVDTHRYSECVHRGKVTRKRQIETEV